MCNEPAKRKQLGRSGTFMAQWFRRWPVGPFLCFLAGMKLGSLPACHCRSCSEVKPVDTYRQVRYVYMVKSYKANKNTLFRYGLQISANSTSNKRCYFKELAFGSVSVLHAWRS